MNLREAQEEYKMLEVLEQYYLNCKELAKSLVTPKSTDIRSEVVDGGKIEDKMLLYAIMMDEKKIEETLTYIRKKKKLLMDLIEQYLKIRNEYGTLERKIYDLRNDPEYLKTHNKPMPFWKIGNIVGYSRQQCINIYNKISQKLPN